MPRVTRAALRSNALLEEADLASSTPLPLTRVPLGEIAGNKEEIKSESHELSKAEKKPPVKGKKGKVTKEAKKQENDKTGHETVEILEDDNQSATSSAVDEACQNLMQESSGGKCLILDPERDWAANDLRSPEIHQVVMHDERPHTPPSHAVNAVNMQLNSVAQTPKFDPSVHKSGHDVTTIAKNHNEDSFVQAIDSRTPAKMTHSEHANGVALTEEALGDAQEEKDDSFIEQIMKRSPVKQVSRIEDSVEAIDAFEEAIEKVGELIPAITDDSRLSSRMEKQANAANNPDVTKQAGRVSTAEWKETLSARSTIAKTKKRAGRANAVSRKQVSPSKLTADSKAMLDHGSEAGPASAPKDSATSSSTGASKPITTRTKRVSSIHKAPFQPTKSTKPPTRATFELPGDAVARKLKEQREERLKRDEGEGPKKPVPKARPFRLSQAPIVKATATSRARLSLAKADPSDPNSTTDRAPRIRPITRLVSMSTADVSKRLSSLSVAKRESGVSANTSARPVRNSSISNALARRSSIMGPPSRPFTTAPDLAQQKLRGKEVFNRVRVEQDERDRIKKEKEEAARKARAEAAERGRIASREWAERQKAKKMTMGVERADGVAVADGKV